MRALLLLIAACGGTSAPITSPPPPPATGAKTCDDVRPRIEQLYGADPMAKRVPDFVTDNTAMVMNDCAKQPHLVVCLARASTVADLERTCLVPIDDEGSEASYLQAKDVSGR